MQIEEDARVHHTSEHHGSWSLEVVPGKSRGDQRVIMRPDRTIVIRHRIVARFTTGYCAHSPSRKGVFIGQGRRNAPRVCLRRNTREKTMTSVRRSHPAGPLAAVQSECVCGKLFTPEDFLEPAAEALCPV